MRIHVVDPASEEIVTVPLDQLKDAIEQGFREASPGEVAKYKEQLQYTDPSSKALAGLAGAARGATLGLSDLGLTKTGLVEPETLKKLEEYNPVESVGGEVAGVVGSLVVPAGAIGAFGKTAKAVTAPARAATAAGEAAMKQTAKLLPAATSGLGRATATGVQIGAGTAVESGLYGLGRAVTEYSMGNFEGMDPATVAESVFAHAAMPMLIGGGMGAAFGSTFGLSREAFVALKRAFPDVPTPVDTLKAAGVDIAPGLPKTELGDALSIETKPLAEQESFAKGIKQRSDIANDVEAIALKHRLPVFEEQLTRDPDIIAKADALRNSPSVIGVERKRAQLEAEDYFRQRVTERLAVPDELANMSQKEIGERIADRLSEKLSESQAAHGARFEALHDIQRTVDLSDKARLKLWKKAEEIAQTFGTYGDEPFEAALDATNKMISRNTGSELMTAISNMKDLSRAAFRAGKSRVGTAINQVIDEAEKMLFSETLRLARQIEKEGAGPLATAAATDFVQEIKEATRAYAGFKRETKQVMNALGIRGPEQTYLVKQKLAEMPPERIVERLFAKRNVRVAEFFNKYAPEVMLDIKAYQKTVLKDKATRGEGLPLSMKMLFNDIDRLPKELKNLLFDESDRLLLKESEIYLRAIPEDLNTSRTAYTAGYMQQQGLFNVFNPLEAKDAWTRLGRDAHTASELRKYNLTSDDLAKTHWISERTLQMKRAITRKVNKILSFGPVAARAGMSATALVSKQISESLISHEKPEKTIAKIYDVATNPEVFIDRMTANSAELEELMPNTFQQMQLTASQAVQFLRATAPPIDSMMPLDERPIPSRAEINLFAQNMALVTDPTTILDEMAQNTLTSDRVQAVKQIYPKLHDMMAIELMQGIVDLKTKKQALDYRTKNMLSLFFGQDLESTLTAQSLIATQQAFNRAAMQEQAESEQIGNAIRPTLGGLGKLSASTQNLTEMQKSTQRIKRG